MRLVIQGRFWRSYFQILRKKLNEHKPAGISCDWHSCEYDYIWSNVSQLLQDTCSTLIIWTLPSVRTESQIKSGNLKGFNFEQTSKQASWDDHITSRHASVGLDGWLSWPQQKCKHCKLCDPWLTMSMAWHGSGCHKVLTSFFWEYREVLVSAFQRPKQRCNAGEVPTCMILVICHSND